MAVRCAGLEGAERAACQERRRHDNERQRERRQAQREAAKAEADRQRKARLAKRTIPCSAPGCDVPVAQDGDTPAALLYCDKHRDLHRPHRSREVKSSERSRWLREQDRRLPVMP